MLRAGVCINCAKKTAALILESGPEEIAVEPCSGACREAIELYFSTPPERAGAHAVSAALAALSAARSRSISALSSVVGDDSRLALALDGLGMPLQHPL